MHEKKYLSISLKMWMKKSLYHFKHFNHFNQRFSRTLMSFTVTAMIAMFVQFDSICYMKMRDTVVCITRNISRKHFHGNQVTQLLWLPCLHTLIQFLKFLKTEHKLYFFLKPKCGSQQLCCANIDARK